MIKRILYLERNVDGTIGGSYYSLLYLLQGLDKTKYEIFVVFLQDNVLVSEFKEVTPFVYVLTNDSFAFLKTRKIGKWIRFFIAHPFIDYVQMKNLIKMIKPDLVHLNNSYSNIIGYVLACYRTKTPVIAHDRGTQFPCSYATKYFAQFLNGIICVSESYKNNVIRQGIKVKRLHRIYNGLDVERVAFALEKEASKRIRDEFHLEDNASVVGIVGNIQYWKGQLVVLKTIDLIKQKFPNIKCLLVGPVCMGEENYQKELESYILQNQLSENIIFTGFRKDILNVISVLDILIHASVTPEPFARTILEGMALAKPIIGTNAGGTIEQLTDMDTGLLVPMNDESAMANALEYYLSDMKRAQEIGQRGRKRLIEMFSIKRMVEETEKVYEELFCSQ